MTGYDLYKSFRSSVGYVWHAPDSQIYPELRKMEREGLIAGTEIPWGTRGTKKLYTITDVGVMAFRDWMNTTLEYSRERDPVHLKAAYFEWADPQAARAQLEAHLAYYSERRQQWLSMIDDLRSHSNPTLARRLQNYETDDWERVTEFKVFSYRGLVAQAEQQIEWARDGLSLIDRLQR
jgi:PadR family transcriptional regulator AphA